MVKSISPWLNMQKSLWKNHHLEILCAFPFRRRCLHAVYKTEKHFEDGSIESVQLPRWEPPDFGLVILGSCLDAATVDSVKVKF